MKCRAFFILLCLGAYSVHAGVAENTGTMVTSIDLLDARGDAVSLPMHLVYRAGM